MTDEDWRNLERGEVDAAWRQRLARAPTEFLAGMHERLSEVKRDADQRLAILDNIVPRCKCGRITDACAVCGPAVAKFLEMRAFWSRHGIWSRWLAGSEELIGDLRNVMALARDAGMLGQSCVFPGCDESRPRALYRCYANECERADRESMLVPTLPGLATCESHGHRHALYCRVHEHIRVKRREDKSKERGR